MLLTIEVWILVKNKSMCSVFFFSVYFLLSICFHLCRGGAWQRLEKVVVLELTVAHLRRLAGHHPGECGTEGV